jgi:hypothetical protein
LSHRKARVPSHTAVLAGQVMCLADNMLERAGWLKRNLSKRRNKSKKFQFCKD